MRYYLHLKMHSTTFNDKILRCVNSSEALLIISSSSFTFKISLLAIFYIFPKQDSLALIAFMTFYTHDLLVLVSTISCYKISPIYFPLTYFKHL